MSILRFGVFDQFYLVPFRRIDESDPAAAAGMWTVRKRITFGGGFTSESVKIVYFECQMREVGADHDRPALVEFADFDFFLALRRFEKDKLRAASGSVPPRFLESEHVPVKGHGFFQISHAIAGV